MDERRQRSANALALRRLTSSGSRDGFWSFGFAKQRQPTSEQAVAQDKEQEQSPEQASSGGGEKQEAGNAAAAGEMGPSGMSSEGPSAATPALDAANQEMGGGDEGDDGEQAAGGYAEMSPSGGSDPADASDGGTAGGGGAAGGSGGDGGDGGAAAQAALASAASGSTGVSHDSGPVPTSASPAQADAAAGNSAVGNGATGGLGGSDVGAGTGNAASAAEQAVDSSELVMGEDVPEIVTNFQTSLPSEMASSDRRWR